MSLDVEAIAGATGRACSLASNLCQREIGVAEAALTSTDPGPVIIACGQEALTFDELAADLEEVAAAEGEAPSPLRSLVTADIRDRAGWSDEAGQATPKQVALLAEAMLPPAAAPVMPLAAEGVCLVIGPGDVALGAAARLADQLSVTCLLTDTADALPPWRRSFPIVAGRLVEASGHLGAFSVRIDAFAAAEPGGRGGLRFDTPRDGARSRCDIILDLSGATALFPAPQKRDGYLRADPRDPIAVERAVFDAAQMVGEFEKPLYIRFEESLCAHSRARQPGCDRCLNVCPTGAIVPNGDHVSIDPAICAGCGGCAAVCPTGAARYDDPPFEHQLRRMQTMIDAYRAAGDAAPRLLVHDAAHGAEMIALAARFERGLPADVLPLEMAELAPFGHHAMLAALAMGYATVAILLGPEAERETIEAQTQLAEAMAAGANTEAAGRIVVLDPAEPASLCDALFGTAPTTLGIEPILPLGEPRAVTRLAMTALAGERREPVALGAVEMPGGVPYGAVLVNTDTCTLCLACVSLCPTGALGDNPDRPELRFQEDACVQCGICAQACPETAITLEPRFDLSEEARQHRVLNEEEPFACIECGALFGVKSTVERISEKLAGKNWMYTNSDNVRLIQMCDDCRVRAQYHSDASPFAMGARPAVRTTEDYLRERDEEGGGNGSA
ncbi:MAG: 4Fe-4S binding protein [Pseudomonadota bacterium]